MLQNLFEEIHRVVECGGGGCGRAFKESVSKQIMSEDELYRALANHRVVAKDVGPFGGGESEVVFFGDIASKKARRYITVDREELEEFGYESEEEYCNDFAGTDVIILEDSIGQSDNNFYMLDGRDVADCEIYIAD